MTFSFFQLNPEHVFDLLTEEFGYVPRNGCIAGGAVASAIFKLLDLDIIPQFNDLDHFTEHTDETDIGFITHKYSSEYIANSNSASMIESGFRAIPKNEYSILSTTMTGRRNTIKVRTHVKYKEDFARTIIDGFDLNCVQVALYADERKNLTLTASEPFLDFLKTPKIKPTNLLTGAHTLVRMLEKATNQCFDYDQDSIDMLLDSIAIADQYSTEMYQNNHTTEPALSGWLMAEPYIERLMKVKERHNLPIDVIKMNLTRNDVDFTLFKPVITSPSQTAIQMNEMLIFTYGKNMTRTELHSALGLLQQGKTHKLTFDTKCKLTNQIAITHAQLSNEIWEESELETIRKIINRTSPDLTHHIINKIADFKQALLWFAKANETLDLPEANSKISPYLLNLYNNNSIKKAIQPVLPSLAPETILSIIHKELAHKLEPEISLTGMNQTQFRVLSGEEVLIHFMKHDIPLHSESIVFWDEDLGNHIAISNFFNTRTEMTNNGDAVIISKPNASWHFKKPDEARLNDLRVFISCHYSNIEVTTANHELIQEISRLVETKDSLEDCIPF